MVPELLLRSTVRRAKGAQETFAAHAFNKGLPPDYAVKPRSIISSEGAPEHSWARCRADPSQRAMPTGPGNQECAQLHWSLGQWRPESYALSLCLRGARLLGRARLSVDCSPPGSSALGILHARVLEWVAIPSSKGSS